MQRYVEYNKKQYHNNWTVIAGRDAFHVRRFKAASSLESRNLLVSVAFEGVHFSSFAWARPALLWPRHRPLGPGGCERI